MVKKNTAYKFFISSVMNTFLDYREAAAEVIARNEHVPLRAEKFIGWEPSVDMINEKIRNSHCYIGIFHKKWGWVPPNNNPKQLSVTALEYTIAKEIGLPYVLLVSNLPKDEKLQQFLNEIGDYESGKWFCHYNEKSEMTGILGSLIAPLVEKIESKSQTPTDFKNMLLEHNIKSKIPIKTTIGKIYQKPQGFTNIIKNIIDKNSWIIGPRGIGKSVILRKIVDELESQNKMVLFLRAEDILYKKDFQNITKDEFGLSLDELIKLITKKKNLYLVIDSIEAIQRDSEVWASFSAELPLIQKKEKVHTILAIRKSDYAAFPHIFKREWGNEMPILGFTEKQVEKFLKKLNVLSKIDKKFLPVLKTPFYLDLFVTMIPKVNIKDISKISNQYEFLKTHYDQTIRNNPEMNLAKEKVILVNHVAEKMLERKKFRISDNSFPVTEAYNSLRSDGVIIENGHFIEFFHQVYFDFITSLKITESGLISKFLKKVGAELFLRSTIYFTLEYLRLTELDNFVSNIDDVLKSEISHYWKLLVLEFFANIKNAHKTEIQILEQNIESDDALQTSFLKYLIEKKNSFWYDVWNDTLFDRWTKDSDFRQGVLLSNYITLCVKGEKNE